MMRLVLTVILGGVLMGASALAMDGVDRMSGDDLEVEPVAHLEPGAVVEISDIESGAFYEVIVDSIARDGHHETVDATDVDSGDDFSFDLDDQDDSARS